MYAKDAIINIWCEGYLQDEDYDIRKKQKSGDGAVRLGQVIRDKVDKIICEIKEKHNSKYTAQQHRLQANMLQMGTWKDTDNPSQITMFGYNLA